ncbi:DNA repair protein endonuclease SAE2/CtIP C-terminus-domain-containing protein [Copromyces sp. CBS 386.78]|nr:DNA repair protein endonuclease SAE2/CtIP C-terminus-domain-containing protein [Copromyces sp. CBS 386.78]
MTFWDQKGRAAILAAVEAACDTVGKDLDAESREKDASSAAEREALMVKVDQLEKMNQALMKNLEELIKKVNPVSSSTISKANTTSDQATPASSDTLLEVQQQWAGPTSRSILGDISPNTVTGTTRATTKDVDAQVQKDRLAALKKHCQLLQAKSDSRKEALRQVVDQRDQWMKYAEHLERKVAKLKDANQQWAAGHPPPPVAVPDELPTLPTEKGAGHEVAIKEEPSSDEPVVVSERRVRKRRNSDINGEARPNPRRVKRESSDPVITNVVPAFIPQESIDLNETTFFMPTPKKRRHRDPPPPPANGAAEETTIDQPALAPNKAKDNTTSNTPKPAARSEFKLGHAIADVAEDNPEPPDLPKEQGKGGPSDSAAPKPGRLQSLLNTNTPLHREQPLHTPAGVPAVGPRSHSVPNLRRARDMAKSTPLRERPVSELRLEDFKVNPKANNGYTHAFDEVVRGRAERAKLEGCTDPNCCGRAARILAESELSSGGSAHLLKRENIALMEDYLGTTSYRLGTMTMDEKKEVWLKAKTIAVANSFGRHRHQFERKRSPPGYWDPDFPGTQEERERREEAIRRERETVEKRWREAMKNNGRWLFRDE